MDKWKCNNCETINDIENHVCEVCEGKAPCVYKFEYKIDEKLEQVECCWIADNYNRLFLQLDNGDLLEPKGNKYVFNIGRNNVVRLIIENEITRMTYEYPIKCLKIRINNNDDVCIEETKKSIDSVHIHKNKEEKEKSYVSKLIISILLIPIWLLLMVVITAIIGQNDIINVLGLLPLVLLAYYFFKAICD